MVVTAETDFEIFGVQLKKKEGKKERKKKKHRRNGWGTGGQESHQPDAENDGTDFVVPLAMES